MKKELDLEKLEMVTGGGLQEKLKEEEEAKNNKRTDEKMKREETPNPVPAPIINSILQLNNTQKA